MATMEKRNKLSGISRNYKKCVVCNKRRIPGSNVHLIRIPLDPDRCRLWIKAIGQEELVDLPIEKLHELKFVCNIHFQPGEFNESTKRLVKNAVPTINLPLQPLPDELFSNFPLHVGQYPNRDSINRKPVQNASPVGDSLQASSSGKEVLRHKEPNSSTLKCDSPPVDDLDDNTSVAAEGALEDYTSADDTGPVQFSWQNSEQISIDEDGDCVPDDAPPIVPTLEMIVENVSKQDVEADINIKPEKHTEYFCDCCSKEIIGFRYTCVQCDNFDLCCSCESKLLHPHHYMLRVPGHKPFSEVNSILEAIREKIKLLTEEAQNSEGLQLDEIKLEEPQFEEVTVDPFSEVTIPVADDHTTQLQAHTSENKSDTTHTIDTKASDMQKEPKIDQPKAPMKIAIRKDVFFKAYKKKTAGEKTIVQLKAIEMQAKNIAPIILQKQRSVVVPQLLNCRVGLSRLKTTQVETHPSTSSQGSASKTTVKQKSLGVKDLDSEARIARENLEENDQEVEMEISRNEKFTSIVKKKQDEATRTQSEEFLDEMWLDDI